MKISLENISKRFGSRWIFKNLSYEFCDNQKYALIGRNGSGKSTLINILLGKSPQSKGQIKYADQDGKIGIDQVYQKVSVASTAMSVIEEFTLEELVRFHFKFRPLVEGVEQSEVFKLIGLEKEKKKLISNFSSGMKQRLKIGLAILSSSELLILDEPGANLDEMSKNWFQEMLKNFLGERILIIASNDPQDYEICSKYLDISEFSS